ncbi:uncharacterized protein [Ambystoma mexicanum]|uniref:uncharacterized protein n=1 Tax=Ambystoma mexicanum TaxID=8296 RepID=UPI0037E8A7DA
MAPEVIEFGHLNLPQRCMDILKESRKPNTRHCYFDKWKRFVIWCQNKQINPVDCTPSNVVTYMLHLLDAGLVFNSLKVHLAALSAYTTSHNKVSWWKVPVVKAFMEGVKRLHPPISNPPPGWDLNVVLAKLMGPPFEPMHKSSLKHLTYKTAFLVAITSIRRVSEIQALSVQDPFFTIHKDKLVLRTHPRFSPKFISKFHVNQSIELPAFFQNPQSSAEVKLHTLDVCRAVLYYVNKTRSLRKTDQLFVSVATGREGDRVSKGAISKWIINCIQLCYSLSEKTLPFTPRAHSTRGIGATLAFIANVPLDTICKAATWSSIHTFTQHYCIDTHSKTDTQVGQAVLRHRFAHDPSHIPPPSSGTAR